MEFPSHIKVGPFIYEVIESTELVDEHLTDALKENEAELLGICESKKCRILLAEGMEYQRQREVLWHEVGHALQEVAGVQPCSILTGEDAIGGLAALQIMVLDDNPLLMEFLFPR